MAGFGLTPKISRNNPIRKVCVVTGTRADYGKLFALTRHLGFENFSLSWFVTGMHMRQSYGLTSKEVHLAHDNVYEYINHNDQDDLSNILIKTISGFKDFLSEVNPDAVVVHGDRVEALAVSIACANAYVRLIHVEGGEVSGTIDESYRHAISKFSHVHIVSSDDAAHRLRLLGEPAERIFPIGSPELDLHAENNVKLSEVKARYNIEFTTYGIFIFHPVTSEIDALSATLERIAQGLVASGKQFVVIRPNNDPGQQLINDMLDSLPKDKFRIIPSMRFAHFSSLLKNAALFVGNSSCGVREAPFLGVPSIDVGSRQSNRSKAASVLAFDPDNDGLLNQAILDSWNKRHNPDYSFGDGLSGQRFLNIMMDEDIWRLSLQKRFEDFVNV